MKRILVTGSREWEDQDAVWMALHRQLQPDWGPVTVVHGDCPTGADLFARRWAEAMILRGMNVGAAWLHHEPYPARWDELGKSAGPIRNKYMVQLGADICLAFPTTSSRGTVGCMKLAQAAGIEVVNLGTLPEGVNWP